MPFTPFHFGPAACVALPARRWIDLPVFVLANVVVDIEPLAVTLFRPDYPYHGYAHTFVIGALVGVAWAVAAYPCRRFFKRPMAILCLPYDTSFAKILVSAIAGVWLHVLLDAPLYPDIRPFFPLQANPLYGVITRRAEYVLCAACFVPAVGLHLLIALSFLRQRRDRAGGS